MANNDNGALQGRPNDSRLEELQSRLNEQGADMAQLKEQMASMVKMMENMTSMMQATIAIATPTPSPITGEDQRTFIEGRVAPLTPITQLIEGARLPAAMATTPTNDDAPIGGGTGAIPSNHGEASMPRTRLAHPMGLEDCEPMDEAAEWEGEVKKLHMEIAALQSNDQKFASNVGDLCVFPKVEVPSKFKILDFVKFDGSTNPEHHLRSYCSIMGNWSRDENFFLAFFHTSLIGAAYAWYMKLDRATVSTWDSMVQAFQRHYSFNILEAPTRDALMAMGKKNNETLREYAKRWRQTAMEVHPALTDYEMKTYFIGTLGEPYRERMIGSGVEDFAKLVSIGEWIDREYKDEKIFGKKPAVSGSKKKEESVNYIQGGKDSQGLEGTLTINYL